MLKAILAEALRPETPGVALPALPDLEFYPIQAGNGGENITPGLPGSITDPSRNRERDESIEL